MQFETELHEDRAGMHSPALEEFEQRVSKRNLVFYILALIFVLIAGSVSVYRYMQRMNDPIKAKHVWIPRENFVTPYVELLSTTIHPSVIKSTPAYFQLGKVQEWRRAWLMRFLNDGNEVCSDHSVRMCSDSHFLYQKNLESRAPIS